MNPGILLVIAASVIFSTGAVFVKIAGVAPHVMMAWRFLIPMVAISLAHPGVVRSLLRAPNRTLLVASVVSLTRVGVWILGIAITPISKAVVILYTWPILFTLFSFIFLKEPVQLLNAIGILLGFTGVLVIALDPSVLADPNQAIGLGLMLVVAILNATNYAVFKGQLRSRGPVEILLYDNIAGATLLFPFVLTSIGEIDRSSMLSVIGYGGLVATVGYFLMYAGLKKVTAATASTLSYLEAVAGASLGIVLFNEPFGARMMVGASLVLIANLVSGVRKREVKPVS